jgi:hypothetical protein
VKRFLKLTGVASFLALLTVLNVFGDEIKKKVTKLHESGERSIIVGDHDDNAYGLWIHTGQKNNRQIAILNDPEMSYILLGVSNAKGDVVPAIGLTVSDKGEAEFIFTNSKGEFVSVDLEKLPIKKAEDAPKLKEEILCTPSPCTCCGCR